MRKYFWQSRLELIALGVWLLCLVCCPVYAAPSGKVECEQAGEELTVARQSLAAVERVIENGGTFGAADSAWLKLLQQTLGRSYMEVADTGHCSTGTPRVEKTKKLDCSLSVSNLNSIPNSAVTLRQALRAIIAATELGAPVFAYGEVSVPTYNSELLNHMQVSYDSEAFLSLLQTAQAHNLFAIVVDPKTGLVGTSGGQENFEMSARQWVTDTVRTGELEKQVSPLGWVKALGMLAQFYTNETEQRAFDKAIADPQSYRLGGPEEGVAHIFFPATLQRDSAWFNNKRLESHGLALKAIVEAIKAGSFSQEKWGIARPDDCMLEAIANLTHYFIAIDYASAPSAGNWEETPFAGGLTWDTEAIRSALVQVEDLMSNPQYEGLPQLMDVRQRLLKTKHGVIFTQPEVIKAAIAQGQQRVRRTYLAESPGKREMDASLAFVASSDISLDDDPEVAVSKTLDMLSALERALVRQHGMLRYAPFRVTLNDGSQVLSPDSYLNLNYNIAVDSTGKINLRWKEIMDDFGSKDASDPEVFAARAKLSTPDREAEWFMVSDLARGYVRQAMRILDEAQKRKASNGKVLLTAEEQRLLSVAWTGATRNINRSYARVTPIDSSVKANGLEAPKWAIPEAWQYVSAVYGEQALPGVNTPLTWAQVSLWGASQEYLQGLQRLEAWRKNSTFKHGHGQVINMQP